MASTHLPRTLTDPAPADVPARWVAGVSLVVAPLLLLTGVLLRLPHDFFFPAQLAAYELHPVLMSASYGCFAAGTVLLWPGVVALTARIGARCPTLALWGGVLAVLGLFGRTFHAGVDHLAFQLVRGAGPREATEAVGAAYGAFHVFSALNSAILAGWVLLAVGAYRARVLGPVRAVALTLTAALPLGVLKGTTPLSVVAVAGLCVALVPLGVALMRERPAPRRSAVALHVATVTAAAVAMIVLGQMG
jgi:hypothetical protein